MDEANFIVWIIVIALSLWVAANQAKIRNIHIGWAVFWCLILGPLWGWIAIALTCKRKVPRHDI